MIALDTSVAVPLLLSWHEAHESVQEPARGGLIPAHALLETYSVLTRLPAPHRVDAAIAEELLSKRFPRSRVLVPTTAVSRSLVRRLRVAGISGGASFDGLVAVTAADHGAELITRDKRAAPTYEALGVSFRLLDVHPID